MYFRNFFQCILLFYSYGKLPESLVYVIIYCVGAGIITLMSISDGLNPYFSRQKMEKTRSMREEMDGRVLFLAKVGFFPVINKMNKILFPICTLIWRVNNYVSRQGKV